ncbi:F0F1 ATP synthase subunit delta [Spiroplasma sp. DGKH1]|uniref:F0F1 ATP synthase subunit delta n=1 Tax=Spiroplasma sp. DGKH1 TaxID=3050074 RepID=UPI0034C5F549
MIVSQKFIENYAVALLELAVEKKKIDEYLKTANVIIDLFKEYPNYIKMLSNTYESKEERKVLLSKVFKGKIEADILHALYLLIDRESFYAVRLIFKHLRKLINERNDVQYGNVYSVEPLTQEQIKRIQDKLIKKFGYNIELVNKIDPNLIGGVKVKIKHEIIDGTLAGQLKTMKEKALGNK